MSRTRLIRPEFYADEKMAALSIPTRFVYMGTWTLADDAGYLEWSPTQIRIALLPYETPVRGQRLIDEALEALIDKRRIVVLDCTQHAVIPTLPDHRIKGGELLTTIKKRHDKRCSVALHSPTSGSVPVSVSDSVPVSLDARAKKRRDESFADWAARIAAMAAEDAPRPAGIGFRAPEGEA